MRNKEEELFTETTLRFGSRSQAFITENVARRTVLHGSSETALTVEEPWRNLRNAARRATLFCSAASVGLQALDRCDFQA